ncbi:hypothetical protein Vadar_001632 [Vaccinium darrowii]|uniref:Uncharacterized protein n=1 Tax=Vaccinium darrowii TaxID=229202 RepID=A0ACB7Z8I2_9ERIC|nr:hypothetical protein Vadar_001632 [Vaccinium darrowii]
MLKELEEYYKGSIVPPNSPQSMRVNSILKKIVEAMHRRLRLPNSGKWKSTRFDTEHLDGMQWQVMVVDSKDYDGGALYLTNGTIVLFTRLLEKLKSDAEVATVLGHEVVISVSILLLSRREMEADYIGMMLMASAGYDPQLAPTFYESQLNPSRYHGIFATHPPRHKRAKKLKEPKVMEQAMAIYSDVTSVHGVRSSI